MKQLSIRVHGTVQGVGLRPTIYRLAREHALDGEVFNDAGGVCIRVAGQSDDVDQFIYELDAKAPPLARIERIDQQPFSGILASGFHILDSQSGAKSTAISADAATCSQCLAEILDPTNRRFQYPFTNCTHCGPRLSIVNGIPYDRNHTSMAKFTMCADCEREYRTPTDRRFHAQPNACPICGPQLWLEKRESDHFVPYPATPHTIFSIIKESLNQGKIVAIKGLGGFQLACDATNEQAVTTLRRRKRRYEKPFALMARDIECIKRYCRMDAHQQSLLQSPAAPIVLLPMASSESLAAAIAPGQNHYGFMLPYTPLHHLIMTAFGQPIVLSSGNLSDEPQCIDNDKARSKLTAVADILVLHDRDIVNRVDDSVVRVINSKPLLIRRARGYAPAPLKLPVGFEKTPSVLALGGELKNTICLLHKSQAILSQHLGDIENPLAYTAFQDTIELYQTLFDHQPKLLAVDAHPEYLSSKWGIKQAAQKNLNLIRVQHHHAHIAACMAENQLPLDTSAVLGIALDGLGYGPESKDSLWGGEFLLADYRQFKRLGHFQPVPMPGGVQAIREPWRMAIAYLHQIADWQTLTERYSRLPFFQYIAEQPSDAITKMIEKKIRCPLTSSCGRLFDAVASVLGICHKTSYEGQAAMALEAAVDQNELANNADCANYICDIGHSNKGTGFVEIDTSSLWQALLHDLSQGVAIGTIAARFHQGLAQSIVAMVVLLADKTDNSWQNKVVLSGGVFQNAILSEQLTTRLRAQGFKVYNHQQIPCNDGGLALGQAVIAAASYH